jgi:hypothetical protein
MTLHSIRLPQLPLGLGNTGEFRCSDPPNALVGWRILVRGPAVFLVSPTGWAAGLARALMDPKGKRRTIEVPRVQCVLVWDGEDVAKLQSFDGEPMERPVSAA